MIDHYAIVITDFKSADIFYSQILDFVQIDSFKLQEELQKEIFQIKVDNLNVYLYNKEALNIEMFCIPSLKNVNTISHICLSGYNQQEIINKCKHYGYEYVFIERSDKPNLLFVFDNNNNKIEIK